LPETAAEALSGGVEALEAVRLEVGRPLRPMLASPGSSLDAALTALGSEVTVEFKLDGARIQVHRDGDDVRVWTRTLREVTDGVPELVECVRALPCRTAVLDGETLALDDDGRPRAFQDTMSRFGSDASDEGVLLSPFFFDLLHLDGEDLLDAPAHERLDRLGTLVPTRWLVPRVRATSAEEAQQFFQRLVADGHEGVVLKSTTAAYAAGRRGAGWVKVKPRHTLDLVVLAGEWGSGRRRGFLSNIHLGARDPHSGGFVMLGKTFKGMTDEMLQWQTKRFLELETSRSGHVVQLRPEQVVEVAFDGIQTSSRYPGGMALRFARVLRYRDDKTAEEADTVDTLAALRT
jgi:DNA ligase-1